MRGRGEGTVFKRENRDSWVARLNLGYKNGKRVRKDFFGKTQKEAREKMARAMEQINNGQDLLDRKLTVGQFLGWWVKEILERDDERRHRTKEDYKNIIRLHLVPHLGQENLGKLNDRGIRSMLKKLQDQGLGTRRRQYIHAVLRIALGDAESEGLVHKNVAKLITVRSSRKAEIKPYDAAEAAQLLQFVKGHRLEALIILAVTTGLRLGEILALTWDAVDEAAFLQLQVRKTLIETKSIKTNPKDWWALQMPKTDKSNRVLWLPDMTREAFHQLRESQPLNERLAHDFVFTRQDGTPLSEGLVDKVWKNIRIASGLRHQRFHDLRHAAASYWLAAGMSLREISGFMGHSSYALTANLYTHLMPAASQDAASLMDSFLKAAMASKEEATHG